MATPNAHRTKAEELLAQALTYPPSSAARLATLTEAQVEALLALTAPPVRYMLGADPTEADLKAMAEQAATAPLIAVADDFGTLPVPEVDEALKAPVKAPRRTRKAAPAKDADA